MELADKMNELNKLLIRQCCVVDALSGGRPISADTFKEIVTDELKSMAALAESIQKDLPGIPGLSEAQRVQFQFHQAVNGHSK